MSGARYWAAWIIIGPVATTLTSLYVVSAIKGEPVPAMWPRLYYALLVNGTWGFGTTLSLRLAGAARDA